MMKRGRIVSEFRGWPHARSLVDVFGEPFWMNSRKIAIQMQIVEHAFHNHRQNERKGSIVMIVDKLRPFEYEGMQIANAFRRPCNCDVILGANQRVVAFFARGQRAPEAETRTLRHAADTDCEPNALSCMNNVDKCVADANAKVPWTSSLARYSFTFFIFDFLLRLGLLFFFFHCIQ